MDRKLLRHRLMDLWCWILNRVSDRNCRYLLYPSFWHYLVSSQKPHNSNNYFTAVPNRGAGIGHQMSNWNSGLWFSKELNLQYAHTTFAQPEWEMFLGLGESFPKIEELEKEGYRRVRLPFFDEKKTREVCLTKSIIDSYGNQKVLFVAEQDQRYNDQYGIADDLRRCFYRARSRESDVDIFDHSFYNVAVHIRRGDIVIGQTNQDPNLTMRWSSNQYYVNVLKNALSKVIKTDKQIHIYLFSQGCECDFQIFLQFENLHFCLDIEPQQTFLCFINADLLITSKSSFSYKPALISDNLKICPKDFWHGYPNSDKWILADENGDFVNL